MKKIIKQPKVKSDMLEKTTIVALFSCAIRKLLDKENKNKRFHYPNRIGQYKLFSKINKTNNFSNYGIAIYNDNKGKKIFVKTWQGKTRNFSYFSLISEYNMTKILSEKFKFVSKDSKIRIPRPIGYFKTQNTFSILREYVDGKLLSQYSVEKQAKVINSVVLFFNEIGSVLSKEEKKYIKKRDRFFHIFSLPLIFLYSFILEKEEKSVIFYSFLRSYLHSISLLDSKLALVHGDLDPNNILISGSHVYILDLEHVKYTLAEYDLSHLSVGIRKVSLLLNYLKKSKNFRQNIFLCLYIAIQFSIFVDKKTKQRPYYNYLKN